MSGHRDLIVEQFTKQAIPYSMAPGIRDETALGLLVETARAGPDDTVLDVACGPGFVTCALAAVVRRATGDGFGLGTRRDGDRLLFAYPVAILVGERPA